jgi:hypothetical protein
MVPPFQKFVEGDYCTWVHNSVKPSAKDPFVVHLRELKNGVIIHTEYEIGSKRAAISYVKGDVILLKGYHEFCELMSCLCGETDMTDEKIQETLEEMRRNGV